MYILMDIGVHLVTHLFFLNPEKTPNKVQTSSTTALIFVVPLGSVSEVSIPFKAYQVLNSSKKAQLKSLFSRCCKHGMWISGRLILKCEDRV